MLRGVAFVSVCTAVLLLTSGPSSAASFDCAKADAEHEKAICADSRLSSADEEVARLYRQVMARPDMTGDAAVATRDEQRAWIAGTRGCYAGTACLEALYRSRIEALRSAASSGRPKAGDTPPPDIDRLTAFLRTYLQDPGVSTDRSAGTPITVAWKDLNGDGRPEALVYLSGGWCGSGGCTLLVIEPLGAEFLVRGRTTITQLPVAVLKSTTRGWRDLVVGVGGGGAPGGQVVLPFQSPRYPGNPTVAPARKLGSHEAIEVLIRDR